MAATPPTHTAYHVRKYKAGKEEKSFWTKIGSVWTHKNGQGFNIRLNGLVPLNGEIVVLSVEDKTPKTDDGEADFVDADGVVS
jgi:hypothetical protein